MTDPTIASWSRESDLLFQLRQLREENERFKKEIANQRPWVGLTDEEMSDIVADIDVDFGDLLWKVICLTKIIEAKLKELNK